jgi:hypothetical protein
MTTADLPPCLITIDKEGRWFHEGREMIHRDIVLLLYQHLEVDAQGQYVIEWQGERCYVEVEDVPFVVRRVVFEGSSTSQEGRFLLSLSDDTQEPLAPETLSVGHANVLYCRVKDQSFPARFNRPAYYQLAEHIETEDGVYVLPLNGKKHVLQKEA